MAAIAAWNAVYLSQAVEELKKRGEVVPEEYLPHITPLGWEHINLIGQSSSTSPLRTRRTGDAGVSHLRSQLLFPYVKSLILDLLTNTQ